MGRLGFGAWFIALLIVFTSVGVGCGTVLIGRSSLSRVTNELGVGGLVSSGYFGSLFFTHLVPAAIRM